MMTPSPPPLIPREDLFGDPERTSPQLSPDGRLLAYLAPLDGVLNVWLRSLSEEDDRPITRDTKRGIRMYFWAYDGHTLLYLQDADGDENWHVWAVDVGSMVVRDLTPLPTVQAQPVASSHRIPGTILVALNARDERFHDVHRIDLATGELTMVAENPGDVVGWVEAPDLRILGAYAARSDGGFELRVRDDEAAPWRTLVVWGPDDEGSALRFTDDASAVYVTSSLGSDREELRLVDVRSGSERTLASHGLCDVSELLWHPTESRVRAAGFAVDRLEWQAVDRAIAPDLARLGKLHDGDFLITSTDLADRQWVVLYVQDRAPASYHLYDRSSGALTYLFTTRPRLDGLDLAEMRPVRIAARDGLTLHSYLTLPTWGDQTGLPLVLNVHGGPWARDRWGYDGEAQWLANRGYACLQVNFRGSTGFGKAFLHAGDREWGGKMHDDLIDAVRWAVAEGIADPKRVAIYGASYGGYAALVGASFTPDVFACAVDVVGPSSIRSLIQSIPPYWEPMKRVFTVRVGDIDTEPDFLDSRSPLYRVDRIVCPMLIAQGRNDPRVKQAESEQIVQALRDRGKPVEYLLFEDEGHGFARPANRLVFYAAAEEFLARYLGGRSEPSGVQGG